jgi:hypothetical protein
MRQHAPYNFDDQKTHGVDANIQSRPAYHTGVNWRLRVSAVDASQNTATTQQVAQLEYGLAFD